MPTKGEKLLKGYDYVFFHVCRSASFSALFDLVALLSCDSGSSDNTPLCLVPDVSPYVCPSHLSLSLSAPVGRLGSPEDFPSFVPPVHVWSCGAHLSWTILHVSAETCFPGARVPAFVSHALAQERQLRGVSLSFSLLRKGSDAGFVTAMHLCEESAACYDERGGENVVSPAGARRRRRSVWMHRTLNQCAGNAAAERASVCLCVCGGGGGARIPRARGEVRTDFFPFFRQRTNREAGDVPCEWWCCMAVRPCD